MSAFRELIAAILPRQEARREPRLLSRREARAALRLHDGALHLRSHAAQQREVARIAERTWEESIILRARGIEIDPPRERGCGGGTRRSAEAWARRAVARAAHRADQIAGIVRPKMRPIGVDEADIALRLSTLDASGPALDRSHSDRCYWIARGIAALWRERAGLSG